MQSTVKKPHELLQMEHAHKPQVQAVIQTPSPPSAGFFMNDYLRFLLLESMQSIFLTVTSKAFNPSGL